jgi:hypothetical protein
MSIEDRLAAALRERSAVVSPGATDLHSVRAAAVGIRSRRRARALAMSACCVAVLMLVTTSTWGWISAPRSVDAPPASATSPDAPELRGRPILDIAELEGTWRVVDIGGARLPVPVFMAVRSTGDGWQWGGPADDCHDTGGPASIAAGTLSLTATIPIPMDICGANWSRNYAASAIQGARGAQLIPGEPDRIALVRGDTELAVLEREPAIDDPDEARLAGRWVPESIDGVDLGPGRADREWPLVITFDYDDARTDPAGGATSPLWFSARFDCNTASGPIVTGTGSFSAEVDTTTQVACRPADYRGTDVRDRLLRADRARLQPGTPERLELLQGDVVVLTLRRAKLPLTGSP